MTRRKQNATKDIHLMIRQKQNKTKQNKTLYFHILDLLTSEWLSTPPFVQSQNDSLSSLAASPGKVVFIPDKKKLFTA